MNSLRRAVAQIAFSRSAAKGIVLYSPSHFTQPYSTEATQSIKAPPKTTTLNADDFPKPSEIPFQVKVANSVNLIGYVDSPVQFQTSADGKHWAGTVITQHATFFSPSLWIPILFEGDLAQIAVTHLKKDDHVHISGQLTADPPSVDGIEGQANVQVMVHSLNFIDPASHTRKSFASKKQEAATIDHLATKKDGDPAWRDLFDNPEKWRDYRGDKLNGLVRPRHPDFKCKNGNLSLWLNNAPDWVLPELDVLTHKLNDVKIDVQTRKSSNVKKPELDVLTHKLNDVKIDVQTRKSSNVKKPELDVLTHKLNDVKIDVQTRKWSNVKKSEDDLWKDLVENPDKWWDNRLNKRSERSPDFKHKETGKPLWLDNSPTWVKTSASYKK